MKQVKNKLIYLAAGLFVFNSCQNNAEQNRSQQPLEIAVAREKPAPETTDPTGAARAKQFKDTLVIDPMEYPPIEGDVKLLEMGGPFHFNEVWKTASSENWFGVFENKSASYLAATKIKTRRVHDEIVDDEGEKTGWMVYSQNKDTCVILIQALPYFSDHKIEKLKLPVTKLVPGDTIRFDYQQVSYKLFATGNTRDEDDVKGGHVFINYRLHLSASKKGKYITEMLAAKGAYVDFYVPEIIFAGDIDGDDVPDLIIHFLQFNSVTPVLFLSKPAGDQRLLVPVGNHSSTGC